MILRSIPFVMAVLLGGLPVYGQSISGPADRNCPIGEQTCFTGYDATFSAPTSRYAHGVLGDEIEWAALNLTAPNRETVLRITLPEDVFEDLRPRLADMNGDGVPEVVVIQSNPRTGAQLAIYNQSGKKVATPNIGTRNRWLAPIGVADFNQDGRMDVAYVDRPHLAKTLRVWTFQKGALTEIANIEGVTNHSIGEDFITSSVRICDGRVEMILNDAQRKNIVSVFFADGTLTSKILGPYTSPNQVTSPPRC